MKMAVKWVLLGAMALSLTSCDKVKEWSGSRDQGGVMERRSDPNAGYDPDMIPLNRDGFIIDSFGVRRLNPPTILEQDEGKAVSSQKLSTIGASATGPEDSWVFKSPSKPGRFLVAATSKASTPGGDMIRRIDLNGSIKEFDFDPEIKGTQGAYILIPDEMRASVPNRYIDGEGLFSGSICAFVPGPNQTVIALAGGQDGGVAFVLNPYEKGMAFTPLQTINFPHASRPCRAVYSDALKKLYVVDVTRTEAKNGREGVFVADIYNDNSATIASFYHYGQELKINSLTINNFQDIDLYNDKLYLLSGNGRFDNEWDNVIYTVPLNDLGEPLFDQRKYTQTHNPIFKSAGCGISNNNLASIAVVKTDNGPRILSTGTSNTVAWDISGDELKKVDLNDKRPGVQGINLEEMSRGGVKLLFTPDGKDIIQLPHCRSEAAKVKLDSNYTMIAYDLPVIHAKDLSLGDPIDAGYKGVLASLKGSSYHPQFPMMFADMAVGSQHIGIVGSSGSEISGLGAGGDLIIIDRARRTPIGFTKPTDIRKAHELNYGFKLAEGDPKFENIGQRSHAIIWIP